MLVKGLCRVWKHIRRETEIQYLPKNFQWPNLFSFKTNVESLLGCFGGNVGQASAEMTTGSNRSVPSHAVLIPLVISGHPGGLLTRLMGKGSNRARGSFCISGEPHVNVTRTLTTGSKVHVVQHSAPNNHQSGAFWKQLKNRIDFPYCLCLVLQYFFLKKETFHLAMSESH